MLEMRRACSGYGPISVLHEVSLDVREREIVAVIGANGAGKSTTLKTLSGLISLKSGEILFDGTRIDGMEPAQIAALGLCHVPEGRRVFPELSVTENLMMGAYLRDRESAKRDLSRIHELFPILAERGRQQGGTLSGGEQQMLAIGRALMQKPKLLMLDEPSLGLAPIAIAHIFETINRIREEDGVSILLIEQNAFLALRTADRGYVLASGQAQLSDDAKRLLENPEVKRSYLGID